MKNLITIVLIAMAFASNAQDKLTEYTYAIYISDSYTNICIEGDKVAYFNQIIKHTFKEDFKIFDERTVEGSKYATRW
ncbi:hypothetical protein [Polaribacter glomeratus]|uniref:Uncharacterized protein n=1 Tax=Polaribacter glomeratus TaxID=102 RepID=A0A2S7WGC1_9FLAO|nr:hypothetical protein [Polaribacter glomeratus]PQJ76650.1 hypothetical protein BTO16_12240 [Polaribacter glomeratus]TXD67511.1 hypothetical protein ESX12_02675 [Polaribacter glomeratus]